VLELEAECGVRSGRAWRVWFFSIFFIDPSGRWWMSNEGKKGGREDGLLEAQKLARVIKS
jgi:hypothetical protein